MTKRLAAHSGSTSAPADTLRVALRETARRLLSFTSHKHNVVVTRPESSRTVGPTPACPRHRLCGLREPPKHLALWASHNRNVLVTRPKKVADRRATPAKPSTSPVWPSRNGQTRALFWACGTRGTRRSQSQSQRFSSSQCSAPIVSGPYHPHVRRRLEQGSCTPAIRRSHVGGCAPFRGRRPRSICSPSAVGGQPCRQTSEVRQQIAPACRRCVFSIR